MPTDVYIGIGSNIDAERNILEAIEALEHRIGHVKSSSAYRNPPIGLDGDDFLNLVLHLVSDAGPVAFEEILNDIERSAGRARSGSGAGPRSLDLDLLLYGSLVDAELGLPHADILHYPFVLCPLAELTPGLEHPITGTPVSRTWSEMAHMNPMLVKLEQLQTPATGGDSRSSRAAEG